MHAILHLFLSIPLIVYYCIVSLILKLIPKRFRSKDISGQTVLITGAGSGIGRQLAIQFSKLNTRLVLLDINKKGLNETEFMLDTHSAGVFTYECDVSSRHSVYETASKIKNEVGRVDILVNNAGVVTGRRLLECPDDKIKKTFEVNTLANFWMCKAFLPDMMAANKGHLVFVVSIAGFGGGPKLTDYCSSKFGVIGFEESLMLELEEEGLYGIKSTVACPYLVSTGLFEGFDIPFLRPLTPEYVASEIISAVLVDQQILFIPGFLGMLVSLKACIPASAIRSVLRSTGSIKCMDNFKGRVPPQNDIISAENNEGIRTKLADSD